MLSSPAPKTNYLTTLDVLADGSVHHHFDPFLDIDWDSPEFTIDPQDPRWVLPASDPLGGHSWYQAQPLDQQVAIGFWRTVNIIKVAPQFESILVRGMMQFAMRLPNDSPEFRYCLHEATEECNHIQMFQEFVRRSGLDVPGMRPAYRFAAHLVHLPATLLPCLYFIGILAGEEPIDHAQKEALRTDVDMPAALQRVLQIHIAEEARHISFAHEYLREHLPQRGRLNRATLSVLFPAVLRIFCGAIMVPPKPFATTFAIPPKVMREAFWDSPHSQNVLRGYFTDMRMLAHQTGLMNPLSRLAWRLCRIDGRPARYRGEPEWAPTNAV